LAISDLRTHSYEPLEWEDRVVDQQTGEVLVQGTPVNEVNLNNLESGMLLSHLDIGSLAGVLASLARHLSGEVEKYRRQRILQGEATITSTGGAYFRDADPFVTVSLPADALPQINSPSYAVLIEVTAASDWGAVGQLIVYDKAQNGFKVKMTGSAASVTFRWTIINTVA
jgi:hypothetical protein